MMLQWPNLRPRSDDHSCVRSRGPRKPTLASQPKVRPAVTALRFLLATGAAILISAISIGSFPTQLAAQTTAPVPYENMPEIAPPGVRIGKHIDVPDSAKGPAVDAAKGYRLQRLGRNFYMVTENAYQSMFLVHESGVVVVDAPPSHAALLPGAIAEVTDKPITHIIYSHSHADHIGGAGGLGGHPIIIAHEETRKLLARDNDPNRPLPTVTFGDTYTLKVGGETLELSYHGNGHEPGNIFIYAPGQKTLMVVDVIFPGWMMWRRFALAQDIPGFFEQVEKIKTFDFETLVAGHVARTGTRADVELQSEFMKDLKAAAGAALKSTRVGVGVDPRDTANPWAVFGNYVDRVVIQCVNDLTPKWSGTLAGFDVFIWDQCYAMEQSLRID
jgi:glyoxylase-like metal-dependent hydrolase (beta-lactamase superfamily II)